MKVISTFKVSYVIPETPEEQAEVDKLIADVQHEKLGVDFQLSDLKKVSPRAMFSGGAWRKEEL